jgi:queuosine precursor transporter
MTTQLKVAVGDTWQPKLLPYFAMGMVALMLTTNVLNLKFIDVFGISVIGSQIVYVFSLILADIMAEVYGYRRVRRLLYLGLGCLIVYAVSLQIVVSLPPSHDYTTDREFRTVFAQTPRIAFASIVAYFVTELVNSFVMSRLKVRWRARYFYGRATAAVGIAQVINAATFFGIAFAGVMPLPAILSAGAVAWVTTMVCEIVVLPATKKVSDTVKRYEGIEHFDSAPPDYQSQEPA